MDKLKVVKLLLTHKVAVFINWIFKSFLTRFVFMFTFLTILNIAFFPYPITGTIIILIVSIVFSMTIIRVSSNLNLNLITGTLNMCLINPKEYRNTIHFVQPSIVVYISILIAEKSVDFFPRHKNIPVL